jgi:hypothetical protein
VNTEIARHIEQRWYVRLVRPWFRLVAKTPLQGAQTTLFCCLEDSVEAHSGKYYSDCKEEEPLHAIALNEDDQKRLWDISEKLLQINTQD